MNSKERLNGVMTVALVAVLMSAVASPAISAEKDSPVIQGEVQRVDVDNSMITIDHDPIEALDMPAMTMDFRVPDAAMLQGIETGMNVEFLAVEDQGELVIRALMTTD